MPEPDLLEGLVVKNAENTLALFSGLIPIPLSFTLNTVVIKNFDTVESLFKALDDGEINHAVVPNVMNLEKTISGKYYNNTHYIVVGRK